MIDKEKLIDKNFHILDKGFIRIIDIMGNDDAIVQAARISYGKGTKHSSQDRALIRYLIRHKHTSPLEMCEIKLHIKMPIFVARQWVRHRTANINEYSARYSELDADFYIPELENIAAQSQDNKQGRGENLPHDQALIIQNLIKENSETSYLRYEQMLQAGVARELARIILPVNIYTQWYWKCDLHNLLHFIALRAHNTAQFEIREYANVLLEIIKEWVPGVYEAFVDYILEGVSVSKQAKSLLERNSLFPEEILSKTEAFEFSNDWK